MIFALNPVLATGFAWVLVKNERLSLLEAAGVVLGIVGVGIIASPDPNNLLAAQNVGVWLLIVAAASIALGTVLAKRFESEMPTIAITGWGLLIAGVLIHLTGLGVGQTTPETWPPILIGAIGYLGVFATALTFSAYFALISRVGAVQAALVSYMIPVVTAVVGWLLLEQVVTLSTVSGFLVIAVGFGLTEHEYVSEMLEWTRDHTERRPADD